MIIEEYKETIVHKLEKAVDEKEVEQIINRSIKGFPETDLFRHLVVIYLHVLQDGLEEELSSQNVESGKRRNIRHALKYLKQMNENREKKE